MSKTIEGIILQGEGVNTEFKTTFNADVIETLVAFANAKGGTVYVGVSDAGKLTGVSVGKESVQSWINEVKSKTEPSIIPDVEVIEVQEKQIVALSVATFPIKPIATKGRCFKRVDKANHQLSISEISDLYMQSMQYSWDAYHSVSHTVSDLDFNKVQRFIDKVNSMGRFSLEGSPVECLEKLKYISGKQVTNAAVLLFGKEGSTYNVHLGRFKTPSMIIDDKMLRLTLFEAVEETQKYLISHMKVAFEITGETTQRTEILEYPKPAIRELILNCLIHRDYLSPIDVQIKVFDSCITFYNPGKLYGDLTVEDLKTNTYQANARNKLIAEAFYLTGDIEKYGSGFRRIRKELEQYPTMKLECKEAPNGFLATVSYTERKTKNVPEKGTENVPEKGTKNVPEKGISNVHVNEEDSHVNVPINVPEKGTKNVPEKGTKNVPEKVADRVTEKGTEKVTEKGTENVEVPVNVLDDAPYRVTDKVPEKVTEKTQKRHRKDTDRVTESRQAAIISLIRNNTEISMMELSKSLNVNHKTIKRDLSKLKAKGLLNRIGSDKGGYWEVRKG